MRALLNIFDPNGGVVFNISKATTKKELCRVEGISEFQQRMNGINLSGGPTNAVEFCTAMYKLPTFDQLLTIFESENNVHVQG